MPLPHSAQKQQLRRNSPKPRATAERITQTNGNERECHVPKAPDATLACLCQATASYTQDKCVNHIIMRQQLTAKQQMRQAVQQDFASQDTHAASSCRRCTAPPMRRQLRTRTQLPREITANHEQPTCLGDQVDINESRPRRRPANSRGTGQIHPSKQTTKQGLARAPT